jgi:HSP20 family protein
MTNLLVRRRNDLLAPWFEDLFSDFWTRAGLPAMPRYSDALMTGRALMDVVDKGEMFEIKVDMPGVKKEEIEVTVEGARVAISAQTKSEKEVKERDKVLHTERYAATYARTFELPVEVTQEGAEARYKDGVLTLMLHKRTPQASTRLAVH